MNILPTKRVMLSNLQPGQHIDQIVFDRHGNPLRVQSEIVRIEKSCNFGRIWLVSGPLTWQTLTFKYQVALAQIQLQKRTQTTPTITTQRTLHA
jgi:hypothetical protein